MCLCQMGAPKAWFPFKPAPYRTHAYTHMTYGEGITVSGSDRILSHGVGATEDKNADLMSAIVTSQRVPSPLENRSGAPFRSRRRAVLTPMFAHQLVREGACKGRIPQVQLVTLPLDLCP